MCLKCISGLPQADLDDYMLNFLGHGSNDADWIFISIEERGSPCSARDRIDYWQKFGGKSALVDGPRKEAHLRSFDPSMADIYGSNGKPASQKFLRYVENIVEMTCNPSFPSGNQSADESVLNCIRIKRTGNGGAGANSIALLELHPLPHYSSSNYDYSGLDVPLSGGGRKQLNSRREYEKWCDANRTNQIVQWVATRPLRNNPIRVVVLGQGQLLTLFNRLVGILAKGGTSTQKTQPYEPIKGVPNSPITANTITASSKQVFVVANYVHPSGRHTPLIDRPKLCSMI